MEIKCNNSPDSYFFNIKYLLQTFKTVLIILRYLGSVIFLFLRRKSFLNQAIKSLVATIQLSKNEILRVRQYISLSVIFGKSCYKLHGEKLNDTALESLLFFGIAAPLHDDLVDNQIIDNKRIELIANFTKKIVGSTENKRLFYNYLQKLNEIQKESAFQFDKSLNFSEVEKITRQKGGYTALLFRSSLDIKLIVGERRAFYLLGILFQLMDDCFDLYDDSIAGIKTLFTVNQDFEELRDYFKILQDQTAKAFRDLPLLEQQKNHFFLFLALVFSRMYVCLDFYENKNQTFKTNLKFEKRKDWICDMEKPRNIIKSLSFSIRLYVDIKRFS